MSSITVGMDQKDSSIGDVDKVQAARVDADLHHGVRLPHMEKVQRGRHARGGRWLSVPLRLLKQTEIVVQSVTVPAADVATQAEGAS